MTYFAHVVEVPAPAAVYDATHSELLRRTGGHVDGLIVHLCRATEGGFQVVEVWTDRAAFERAEREHVGAQGVRRITDNGAGTDADFRNGVADNGMLDSATLAGLADLGLGPEPLPRLER
ncbi:hypothetical protein ACVGOW_33765 [Pseudonocardia saturnea]